jgi:tRNA(fMet)-specific endonuclease VapC
VRPSLETPAILGVEKELNCSRAALTVDSRLERAGTPVGAYDVLIASQALAVDAVLVTDNEREFARVPDLATENWTQPISP